MADPANDVSTEDDLEGGTALAHPEPDIQPVLVAPTIQAAQNTVRAFLIPVGCWRLDDLRFDFDSSFVRASAKKEMVLLAKLVKEHPKAPLTIFGHADPVGPEDYNKTLSGRRARAIYAMIIRDTAAWEDLYTNSFGGDKWGVKSIQRMLFFLDPDSMVPFSGVMDATSIKALQAFQKKNGISPSSSANSQTRAALFQAYMDAVCVDADGSVFKLTKGDFLAKGADADGKGDFQGCGEFNPVLIFSEAEQKDFDKPKNHANRNASNAPNRRVMALLFRPGTVVDPGRWPCPSFKDGVSACKARFWANAAERGSNQEKRRTFDVDHDTYECRFYHRLFQLSPCAISGAAVISVLQINASVQGTKGVRNKANQRPMATLASSSSTHDDLKENPPVVLVRGCNDVELEAITTPVAPVTWTVTPNHNKGAAPAITPIGGGRKAILKTDQGGSFAVTASTGASKVVWNVVFVTVKVDLDSVVVITRDDQYADNKSNAARTSFRSGEFKKDKFAWEANINKIELTGGGDDGKLGIDEVQIHYLQNGVKDTLTGNYIGGATAEEVPQGGLPNVDSNTDAGGDPTADFSLVITPDQTSAVRTAQLSDSPAGGFPRVHPNSKKLVNSISGVNGFRAALGSACNSAPDAFVVHAELSWHADFAGDVATTGKSATYTANGAETVEDATITQVSEATGGQDAGVAGFDLFEPRFNGGTDTKFTP